MPPRLTLILIMTTLKRRFACLCLPVLLSPLCADTDPSEMERVLLQLERLNTAFEQVNQRLDELEAAVVSLSAGAVSSSQAMSEKPASDSFIERVVDAVQFHEEKINFPWMNSGLWDALEPGMSPKEVISILGEPTLEDPSLHKRVDTVYTYRGRKPSSGEKVVGKVKFYKGRVVEIEKPQG